MTWIHSTIAVFLFNLLPCFSQFYSSPLATALTVAIYIIIIIIIKSLLETVLYLNTVTSTRASDQHLAEVTPTTTSSKACPLDPLRQLLCPSWMGGWMQFKLSPCTYNQKMKQMMAAMMAVMMVCNFHH
jgi:hypothetical protein